MGIRFWGLGCRDADCGLSSQALELSSYGLGGVWGFRGLGFRG